MSLKEIAKQAGVSVATVSRVLNNPNYRCADPGMRDKIWQIAMDMKFEPNEAARSLKKQKTEREKTCCLQILMTRASNARQNDPFFRELLYIVESEINKSQQILVDVQYRAELSDDVECRRMNLPQEVRRMREQAGDRCDGMLIIGKCNLQVLKEIRSVYKNVVSINRNSTNYEVDEVLCDGRKVAATAMEYLIGLGHRRIGYVGSCRNESRYRGYLDELRRHEIDQIPEYVIETFQTEKEGYDAMETFLRQQEGPTAIYCANDQTAVGMLKYLNTRRSLPFRPSIIASDDIEAAQECRPMLTTVGLPKTEMGRYAVWLLLDRIRGGHVSTTRMEVEGKLIVRDSCQEYPVSREEV